MVVSPLSKSSGPLKMADVSDIRDINQTIFLHLIREQQPISRANITKQTGLSPGTVSAIVNRLIQRGMVYEGTEGPSSGGRRPRFLHINAESYYVLAVDIGVTDTVVAISDFNGHIVQQRSMITDRDCQRFLVSLGDEVAAMIRVKHGHRRFGGIGVSVPGLIDRDTGVLETSPNLEWNDVPIREVLSARFDLPVFVENDANAAAFSEFWYGPLQEARVKNLLFVLVVEGVGTGLIINGQLHVGSRHGLGGFGHMSIDPNGELCSCGRRGCWETFASDRATIDRYQRVTARHSSRPPSVRELAAMALKGDDRARECLIITGEYLGEGISNLAHGIFPETIVVGGEITAAWPIVQPAIMKRLGSRYIISPDQITVRPASMERPSLHGVVPIALQNSIGSLRGMSMVQEALG